jgi:hypothetical protein
MVVGQKIALGRVHAGKTLTVAVLETHLAVECDDGVRTLRRTTNLPVTQIKAYPSCKQRQPAVEIIYS